MKVVRVKPKKPWRQYLYMGLKNVRKDTNVNEVLDLP